MNETIWVSDSDVCEMCDGLLDWFGLCPRCGWDSYPEPTYYEDEEDIDPETYDLDFDEQGRYIGG